MSAAVSDDATKPGEASTEPVSTATPGADAPVTPGSTEGPAAEATPPPADAPAQATEAEKPAATEPAATEPAVAQAAAATAVEPAAAEAPATEAPKAAETEASTDTVEAPASETKTEPQTETKAETKAETEAPAAEAAEAGAKKGDKAPEPGPKVIVQLAGATDVGRIREHNEDNFLLANLSTHARGDDVKSRVEIESEGLLFAVCDGMGGALAGEVASQMAVDVIHGIVQDGPSARDRDHFAQKLVASVQEAGARIFLAAKTNRDRHGMGTTSTVAGVHGTTLFVGQVGDSRAYLYRRGRLKQITKDQSLVSKLIEAGQLTEEQAESYEHAHIILQALGTADTVSVDLSYVDLRQGDTVMLCSDGLSGLATHEQIREILADERDPATACQKLIDAACDAGGHDNVTVIVARFEGELPEANDEDEGLGYQAYVLAESVEALVAGRASSSLKMPDLPPPGSDVKNARSLPPDLSLNGSIAALFEAIPGDDAGAAKKPAEKPGPRSTPEAPMSVPMQGGGNGMSWVIIAAVIIGVIIAVIMLARKPDPSTTQVRTITIDPTTLGDAAPVTTVDPSEPVAPTRLPAPAWDDGGAASDAR